ncbi:MAG: hypothetical protein Q8P20_09115 [bacterium]|nr:hypothetical protein [bacterium]
MLPTLQKKEHIFVITCSFILIVIIFLPAIVGSFSTPADKEFVFMAMTDHEDSNSYLSWIKQAQEGDILFKDKFTSELTKNLIFHPVFLFIGWTSNVLSVPIIYLWFLTIIIANIFLLFTIYIFFSVFFKNIYHRIIAFLLALTSSGFAWFLERFSGDHYLSEISVFRIINRPFIVAFALGLMLWFFIFALRSFKDKAPNKYAIFAGLAGLVLALIHPYNIVTIFVVLAVYIIINIPIKKYFKNFLWIFILPLFPIIYDLIIQQLDWVINEHNKISINLELNFFFIIFSFGLMFICSIPAIYLIIKKGQKRYYFLVFWAILSLIMVYLPFSFRWRLILGAQIPLVILTTYFLGHLYDLFSKNIKKVLKSSRIKKSIVITLFIILLLLSSLTTINQYNDLFKEILNHEYPFYIDQDVMQGIEWLNEYTNNEDIVFSSEEIGNFIPGRSGNIVYLGHWAQTINYLDKLNEAKSIFSGELHGSDLNNFIDDNNIQYIFYSRFEKKYGQNIDVSALQKVYSNSTTTIFRVNNE